MYDFQQMDHWFRHPCHQAQVLKVFNKLAKLLLLLMVPYLKFWMISTKALIPRG